MSESEELLDSVINKLKQERDELKLKIHLASMDAKDDYDRMSAKVDELTDRYEPLKSAVEETTDNVVAAFGMVADELKLGFDRVRKSIGKDD